MWGEVDSSVEFLICLFSVSLVYQASVSGVRCAQCEAISPGPASRASRDMSNQQAVQYHSVYVINLRSRICRSLNIDEPVSLGVLHS